MKNTGVFFIAVYLFCILTAASFAYDYDWEEISGARMNLKAVLVHPDSQKVILIGAKGKIFRTEDAGENWREVFSIRGENNYVNYLALDPSDKNYFYAATDNGLFRSGNQGRNWGRIYKGKSRLESECSAVAILPNQVYLGTKGGLFVSKDNCRSWNRLEGEIGSSHILSVSFSPNEPECIYAATARGVFKTENGGRNWEKIFLAGKIRVDDEIEEEGGEDTGERGVTIRYLYSSPDNLSLYLATARGVYKSLDRGVSWQPVTSYGLLNNDICFLAMSRNFILYAVTRSGVFEYKDNRWHELSLRLICKEIRLLDLDNQGNLYVAGDSGLFKSEMSNLTYNLQGSLEEVHCRNEPRINDVQKAAIKYAEVEPEKIIRWRKQASAKALMPKVSAGINRDTADLWHWESGSTAKTGDDVLARGRDTVGWDVTLSWDLGEVIWNDAQTSIDARSRLMVELRDDILDQITKLYFERLRVKMELNNLSIEDRKRRFEKGLRLQELTASLDALTGGYFSSQIK